MKECAPVLELTKDMLVGIPKIDEQHAELVKMINSATSVGAQSFSPGEIKKKLDFLGDYVVKHFNDEEILQYKSSYPKYEWHKLQHKNFVADFVKLKQEFAANGASAKFSLDLNKSVVGWVVRHIKTADVEFGKYYQAKK